MQQQLLKFAAWTVFSALIPSAAIAAQNNGVDVRSEFVQEADLDSNSLTKGVCKPLPKQAIPAVAVKILTDIGISIIGSATSAAVDYAAAKTAPETTRVEEITPVPAFYNQDAPLISGSCIVIRNGVKNDASDASFIGIFQFSTSPDNTALLLTTKKWIFKDFLNSNLTHWGQRKSHRDFAFKLELLWPTNIDAGTAFATWEIKRENGTPADIEWEGLKQRPYVLMPSKEVAKAPNSNPFNVKITLIETSEPYQFAAWAAKAVEEKKPDIVNMTQEAFRQRFDAAYSAAELEKLVSTATVDFDSYLVAWNNAKTILDKRVMSPPNNVSEQAAMDQWQGTFDLALSTLEAKRVIADLSFKRAGLMLRPLPALR